MNPIAYCAIASCSDKDWEVFSVMLVVLIALAVGGVILDFIITSINNKRKDSDMK